MSTAANHTSPGGARCARPSSIRVIRSFALGALCASAVVLPAGCRSLFHDDALRVSPSSYRAQVERCIAAAEAATGLECRGLRRAYLAETGRKAWSRSLRRNVAVDDGGRAGWWARGEIHAYLLDGAVPDEILIHEAAHQIAADHGLGAADHCPEFRGRIWGWP